MKAIRIELAIVRSIRLLIIVISALVGCEGIAKQFRPRRYRMARAPLSDLLFDRIRMLLWKHWDPIGIGPLESLDGAEDEYDDFARDLARIVARNGSSEELEDYLAKAEDHIGVPRSKARIEKVAQLLSNFSL